jgi:hypothetical protein
MATFKLKNLDGTISEFESHKEHQKAKEIQQKKLIRNLFDEKKKYIACNGPVDSVYKIDYRGFTILLIYGIYNDAFGMILKHENPICTLDLHMYGEEVVKEGVIKIGLIHGNLFPEFEAE